MSKLVLLGLSLLIAPGTQYCVAMHASASLCGKGCCGSGLQGLALFLLSLQGFCSTCRPVSTRPADAFSKQVLAPSHNPHEVVKRVNSPGGSEVCHFMM